MDWKLVAQTVFVGCLLVQIWEDLRWQLLYDEVSLLLAAAGMVYSWYWGEPVDGFYGCLAGGSCLWLLHWGTAGGMGLGDVFLAAALGWWLGWQHTLLMLTVAFIIGGVVAMVLLCVGWNRHSPLPFGPFLALGAVAAFFWGTVLLNWYFGLY